MYLKRYFSFKLGMLAGATGVFLLPQPVFVKMAETYYTITEIDDIK